MSASFKISLMYLLLIIPQHGNSPLPVLNSWLQKDQDDGFAQRDLTSSLTGGDESFGSAQQTYQNSLIRKKKADNLGSQQEPFGYKKFTERFSQSQAYSPPELFFNGHYMRDDYRANQKNDADFEEFEEEAETPSDNHRSKLPYVNYQNDENIDLRFLDKLKSDKFMDLIPSKDASSISGRSYFPERSANAYGEDSAKSAKWSLCKKSKDKYSSNQPLNFLQAIPRESHDSYDNYALKNRMAGINIDRRNRELRGQYREVNTAPILEGNNQQLISENQYYDAELNPMSNDIVEGVDYGQVINNHAFLNKREDSSPQHIQNQQLSPMMENFRNSFQVPQDYKLDNDGTGSFAVQQSRMETGKDVNLNLRNPAASDLMWNFDANLQSEALKDVVKNSQRALKEVQFYQQKLSGPSFKSVDSNSNSGIKRNIRNMPLTKWENKNAKFDDKRLKREDEDEQKNMKTGTDEGGGGEYEDEEGKGHKDEEEYYEDADLSDDESANEIRSNENFNQKYVKREVPSDNVLKISKATQRNSASSDYEFNIENAPVENAEKSQRIPLRREGENAKNNSVRKGVKIWDQWGRWSPCSVTCGVGRSTRWRHCIGGGCAQGEKEAQIKRCTNPAC